MPSTAREIFLMAALSTPTAMQMTSMHITMVTAGTGSQHRATLDTKMPLGPPNRLKAGAYQTAGATVTSLPGRSSSRQQQTSPWSSPACLLWVTGQPSRGSRQAPMLPQKPCLLPSMCLSATSAFRCQPPSLRCRPSSPVLHLLRSKKHQLCHCAAGPYLSRPLVRRLLWGHYPILTVYQWLLQHAMLLRKLLPLYGSMPKLRSPA